MNNSIEDLLSSTLILQQRKVAVFDCDGTLFGQTPYYLADEALFSYPKAHDEGKKDAFSKKKMKIISPLLHGNHMGMAYVKGRRESLLSITMTYRKGNTSIYPRSGGTK